MADDLRELAKAATPGPWMHLHATHGWEVHAQPEVGVHVAMEGETDAHPADGAYIAAAHPQAVLALLDKLDEAENRAGFWKAEADHDGKQAHGLLARIEELEAACDRLRHMLLDFGVPEIVVEAIHTRPTITPEIARAAQELANELAARAALNEGDDR